MSISINRSSVLFNNAVNKKNSNNNSTNNNLQRSFEQSNISKMKRELDNTTNTKTDKFVPKSVIEESISYANSLRESRLKAKNTTTQLKKLRYNFKSVSSQIIRSKTSVSARMAVNAAKRNTIQLKRQLKTGQYDEEEVRLAISHSQSMERIAKKKVRHLEEEEMLKDTGGQCLGELEDKEEVVDNQEGLQAEENDAEYENEDSDEECINEQDIISAFTEQMQQYQDIIQEDMLEELSENMEEFLEETELSELSEELSAKADEDMDPADYKMMKLKHRSKEMKAIAKADAEYLKGVFEKFENDKAQSVMNLGGQKGSFTGNNISFSPKVSIEPAGAANFLNEGTNAPPSNTAAMPSSGFDVSV